ncbi:MAG: DegV family protein [Oscillospiraceae bacterium]|nr:DegV family protein [Oscillospiraceae bacterium]MCL2249596.1 DegV family protein [Oscillospiraceae bacterium]
MSEFKIMIDTGCDVSESFIKENNLTVMPISYQIDGETHDDGGWQKITSTEFYNKLRSGSMATTTLVNPARFKEKFEEIAKKDESLLYISLSSLLSGTYQNAVLALEEVKEEYPNCKIYCLDSINASAGIWSLVFHAVEKCKDGATLEDTAKYLEEKKNSCFALFTVDDLNHLHRGGRVSKLQAVAGTMLGVKPLLHVSLAGKLEKTGKAKGRKGSLADLVGQMKNALDSKTKSLERIIIGHGDCEEDAKTMVNLIKESYEVKESHIVAIAPSIGVHSGPGTIALFFDGDMTRETYEKNM